MRKLEKAQERSFALMIAGDPKTALAHFAIELGGASVWRTTDTRCHVVVPPGQVGDVHIVGTGPIGELLDFLRPLPMDTDMIMSKHLFAKLAHMVKARSMRTLEIYVGDAGMTPSSLPPPTTGLEVRSVLYSDIPGLQALPHDARFLFNGYGDPRSVLARSAAFGAFDGTRVLSLATVELGRTFATIWAYTLPSLRAKGLATRCVAALLDHLRPTSGRPLFAAIAENGSPERAMARRFGLEMAGEMASLERRFMAL